MRNNNTNQNQQLTSNRTATSTATGQVGKHRKYGDIDNSDFVHDEIKELGNQLKSHLKQFQVRDEASLLDNLRMTGPSEQSKAQLRKELEGAQQSIQSGVYYVYRNVAPPKINPRTGKPFMARQQEECCRLGPSHKCFCGHSLADHRRQQSQHENDSSSSALMKRGGAGGMMPPPPCSKCDCSKFTYIPNQPEEVGDGFLSRRKGFVAEAWSAKCRCGCGAKAHDPMTKSCSGCRNCYGFEGNFACGVCDGRWEEHATIMESESDRREHNRATGTDYIPLAGVDQEFREIVFGEETAKALPPASQAARKQIMMNNGGPIPMTSTSNQKRAIGATPSSSSSGPMSRAQKMHLLAHQQNNNNNNNPRVEQVNDDEAEEQEYHYQQQQRQQQHQQAPSKVVETTSVNNSNNNPQQITCSQCNQINRRLAKFCRACGTKL